MFVIFEMCANHGESSFVRFYFVHIIAYEMKNVYCMVVTSKKIL